MTTATHPDTTGRKAVRATDFGGRVVVVIDRGPYPDTKPELNVRKLEELEELPGLTVSSSSYPKGTPYGSGWGAGTGLILVTDEEIEAMRSESQECQAREAKRQAAADAAMDALDEAPAWDPERSWSY